MFSKHSRVFVEAFEDVFKAFEGCSVVMTANGITIQCTVHDTVMVLPTQHKRKPFNYSMLV